MTIPAYATLVYEITGEANDHLNEVAKSGRDITRQDIRDCVTAWVKQFVPNDSTKQDKLITDIIAWQFQDWTPDVD